MARVSKLRCHGWDLPQRQYFEYLFNEKGGVFSYDKNPHLPQNYKKKQCSLCVCVFYGWFLGVADTNDVIQKIEKTLNNAHTTTQKLTNNSFRNTKKHPFYVYSSEKTISSVSTQHFNNHCTPKKHTHKEKKDCQ